MVNFQTPLYTALIGLLLLTACDKAPPGGVSDLKTDLSGKSEVPPTTSGGKGMLDANLDMQTHVLNYTVTYSDMSGPLTAAHFHGPATAAENAGVAVPIAGDLASPISGVATLTAPQAAELMAGKWYVNLHTAANPDGEIRGQVTPP